jgi:hypothetical protein
MESQTIQERIYIVNEIIKEIATNGRSFFRYNDVFWEVFIANTAIYIRNSYNNSNILLTTKHESKPYGFTHGGTIWRLTLEFRDFIINGKNKDGFSGLYSTHWGYPEEDMIKIRNKAVELGFL